MGHEIDIVSIKPKERHSSVEYMVVINPDEYKKWKSGDKTIPLIQVVDAMQIFRSDTGATGKWFTPSAGEIAADFDDYHPDGTLKEGVHDHTKRDERDDDEEEPKGRKAKKVLEETAILITLEHGRQLKTKAIGTGGSDMQTSKGGGLSTGNINTSGR
ncbi:hypothetical protein QFC22_003852 [Naganishia vaughanmartiniae]|uniref:Uncharacterized protein n=1 Tax=Naganishia vaughanmartiniae TaxID=1424756 RepID=A0ACC2X5S0_9TREE|nr:hypothetical protein QFC22_003852 [Naganishia vaughanmartiniae]